MKFGRIVMLTLAFSALSVGVIAASSPWGEYKGLPIVKTNFNNSEIAMEEVPGFISDGTVVLPMRKLADRLQALVTWNSDTNVVDVYKPNVHMFIGKDVTVDGSIMKTFGVVPQGTKQLFVVSAQVDSLMIPIQSIKIDIVDPSGNVVAESDETPMEYKDSFWFHWPFEVNFDSYGKYKARFLMKLNEDSDYAVVSEKVIGVE